MSSVIVWVLVVVLKGSGGSISATPLVVDNIASRENCIGLGKTLSAKHSFDHNEPYSCTAVRKTVTSKDPNQ